MRTVYFDYNATTPLDPQVREAMLPFLDGVYGNPSSVHHVGRKASNRVKIFCALLVKTVKDRPRPHYALALIIVYSGSRLRRTVALSTALTLRTWMR